MVDFTEEEKEHIIKRLGDYYNDCSICIEVIEKLKEPCECGCK